MNTTPPLPSALLPIGIVYDRGTIIEVRREDLDALGRSAHRMEGERRRLVEALRGITFGREDLYHEAHALLRELGEAS